MSSVRVVKELSTLSEAAFPSISVDLHDPEANEACWRELAEHNPPLARFLITVGNELDTDTSGGGNKRVFIGGVIAALRLVQRVETNQELRAALQL